MRSLASLICFLALIGGVASKGLIPISRASEKSATKQTNTTTAIDSVTERESVKVCSNSDPNLAIREEELIKQINRIQESTRVTRGALDRLNQDMQQFSEGVDKVNEAQQAVSKWNNTLQGLKQKLVNEGVESKMASSNRAFDLDYSRTREQTVTVSFNPTAIVTNLQRGVEQVTPSNVANWATSTSQSLAKAKVQINSQATNSVKQLEQELADLRASCNSKPQVDGAATAYSYHSAQPDANLPPVTALSCNDPRVVSNPKQACQVSPGLIRMPRLDF
jgi:DNA repair exonuclease SbcCD ATPase subunit